MLRPAATLNRTEVQSIREMKQPATRQLLLTPAASDRSCAYLPTPRMQRKLSINVRLFKH